MATPMPVRSPSGPKGPEPELESDSWRAHLFAKITVVLKLIAIPAAISLAMILPEYIVRLGNFTTGLMTLNDQEKTEILRSVFRRCGDQDWAFCENYNSERWSQEALIYLADIEDLFNKRNGGKLRKSIGTIFRPSYIRASFYETMTGDIKKCASRMEVEISRTRQTEEIFYMQFLRVYNASYTESCRFFYEAFMHPIFAGDLGSQQARALQRRLTVIDKLTEAVGFPVESTIPTIRARLSEIERETLFGLTDVCSVDIPSRTRKLSNDVGTIWSALYGTGSTKTSIRDLEHAEEEAARALVKNILLVMISLLLLIRNARKLGVAFNEVWATVTHHG
jgi:hypothetical protein